MSTIQEQFKLGFATKLAELGLLPSDLEKAAGVVDSALDSHPNLAATKTAAQSEWFKSTIQQKREKQAKRRGECLECHKPNRPENMKCTCATEKKAGHVKQAFELPGEDSVVKPVVATTMKGVEGMGSDLYGIARNLSIAAPFALPMAASYGLNSLDRTSKEDVEALQESDLILAYRRAAQEIKRRQAARGVPPVAGARRVG